MIAAVTGGRGVIPPASELADLQAAFLRRRIRVLRVGCCPTGVDAAVLEWARALPDRMFAIERWVADWPAHGRKAGPIRNRGMVLGDDRCADFVECSAVSYGPISVLVHWPGGAGTKSCVSEARSANTRWVLPIAQMKS